MSSSSSRPASTGRARSCPSTRSTGTASRAEIASKTWGGGANVVGYAYAIAHNGAILRSGAGGDRRLSQDGGRLPFTTHTQAQTASTAKTINATAIIKALYDRGLTVDTKVAPYLPSCWERGKDVATLTFRQILSHTSGLPKAGSACNFGDGYKCLLDMIKKGRIATKAYTYNTHAYDLLRFLVPMVVDRAGTMGEFELFKCKNTSGILNRKVSEKFVRYVFGEILDPVGADASFYPSGDFSYNYDEDNRQLKGDKPRQDFFMRAGSGKLTISVLDYIRFLSALDRGLIIPKGLVEMMKGSASNRLGFDSAWNGSAGAYHWKNGRLSPLPGDDRRLQDARHGLPRRHAGLHRHELRQQRLRGQPDLDRRERVRQRPQVDRLDRAMRRARGCGPFAV